MLGRVALVVTFAAVVALVLIFARPISQGAHALVDATSRLFASSKSTDLLTASNASSSEPAASPTRTASASVAAPVPAPSRNRRLPPSRSQRRPLSRRRPQADSKSLFRHPHSRSARNPRARRLSFAVSPIMRFGLESRRRSPAQPRSSGTRMKLGIQTAFNLINDAGGIHGRQLS